MQSRLKAIARSLAARLRPAGARRVASRRSGLTLTEVLLALGVFMVGSVGVIGLFVTASILHAEAGNRRTASFVTEELLSRVKNMRFRDVFARTELDSDWIAGALSIDAKNVSADLTAQAANFNQYPRSDLFFPLQPGQDIDRNSGALLIGGEWFWYRGLSGTDFTPYDSDLWGSVNPGSHAAPALILQPRTWYYVLNTDIARNDDTIPVDGDPEQFPSGPPNGAPDTGYIVIDEEWIQYDDRSGLEFSVVPDDDNGDGIPDGRGIALTTPVAHRAGTPVTVAREHERYPNFWYTVQFYPTQPNGAEAQVVVSVAYKTQTAMRAWTLRSIYTPSSF